MVKKNIFKKNSNKKKYTIISFLFILLFLIFFLLNFFYKKDYLIIPINYENFYNFPKDRGGVKILNQNKKGLHLSNIKFKKNNIKNNLKLNFSIQIYSNDYLINVENKKKELLNFKEFLFYPNDIYITTLSTNLGDEYLILYKNFKTRNKALNYCKKNTYFNNNCVIVDVQKMY